MDKFIYDRTLQEANHILETEDTIRTTAKKFNVSKSTVFNDLTNRLKEIDDKLYSEIDVIFKNHDKCKHIRGGETTKQKYKRG